MEKLIFVSNDKIIDDFLDFRKLSDFYFPYSFLVEKVNLKDPNFNSMHRGQHIYLVICCVEDYHTVRDIDFKQAVIFYSDASDKEILKDAYNDVRLNFVYYGNGHDVVLLFEGILKKIFDLYKYIIVKDSLDRSNQMVVITDNKQNIDYINDVFTKVTGYSEDEALGTYYDIINHNDNDEYIVEHLYREIFHRKPWKGMIINRDKKGKHIYENSYIKGIYDDNKIKYIYKSSDLIDKVDNSSTFHVNYDEHFHFHNIISVDFQTDKVGNILFERKGTNISFGYSYKDYREGINIFNLVAAVDYKRAKNVFDKLLQGESDYEYGYYTAVSKEGNLFPVIIYAHSLKSDGKVEGIKGVCLDLSDLKENEKRFDLIMHNINGYIYSTKYRFNRVVSTYHSPKCYDITGYTQIDYMQNNRLWLEMVYEDDKDMVERFIQNVVNTKKASKIEHRIIHKDGRLKWVMNACSVVTNTKGDIVSINGIILDITERKEMEESIRYSEEKFRTLIEKGSDIIFLIGFDSSIKYVSPSIEYYSGYKVDDILGKLLLEFVDPEDKYYLFEILSNVFIKKDRIIDIEFRFVTSDNKEIILEAKVRNLLADDKVNGIVFNCRDITQQKQLLHQLEELALFDELTGLHNRRGFMTLAEQQLKVAKRSKNKMILFFIDMDNMKEINDRLGHDIGDIAIQTAAKILRLSFRDSDVIGRLGGDEFVVLIYETNDYSENEIRARLEDTTRNINLELEYDFKIELSIGISLYDPNYDLTIEKLIKDADVSMYKQKNKRKEKKMLE